MCFEEGASLTESINWVTRRFPAGLRSYYQSEITFSLEHALS